MFLVFALNLSFIGVLALYLLGVCLIAWGFVDTLKLNLYNTPKWAGAGVLPY